MTIAQFIRLRAFRHGVVWLIVASIFGTLSRFDKTPTQTLFLSSAIFLGVSALAIYLHDWLLTNLMDRRRYTLYATATLATLLAAGELLNLLNYLANIPVFDKDGRVQTGATLYGNAVGSVFLAVLLATIFHYVRRGIVSHFQMQQLRALQLETELSLLKAQVNQHFLFNTLNNLYGLSLAAPEQMPEALLQLSGLMRYQLDSSRQATVTVGTEAEYLANYIGLEKLRLRDNTQVEFTVDLPRPEQPLAPLLLLPLVENCFKHAIGPSGRNTIRIELTQTDTGLTLRTGNSIPPHFRATPSGLGLPTLRARLAQYYPGNRHRLDIKASDTFYAATLQLML